jgi:hypothetical protein
MGLDDFFARLLVNEAVSGAIEKKENQITFEVFVQQASSRNILTYKKGCEKGFWGQPLDTPPYGMKGAYMNLYDLLFQIGIVEKRFKLQTFITLSRRRNITNDVKKLSPEYLKKSIEESNTSDAVLIKNCYTIDYDELSKYLMDYNKNDGKNGFNQVDKVKGMNPLGGNGKRRTRRRRKRSVKKL